MRACRPVDHSSALRCLVSILAAPSKQRQERRKNRQEIIGAPGSWAYAP